MKLFLFKFFIKCAIRILERRLRQAKKMIDCIDTVTNMESKKKICKKGIKFLEQGQDPGGLVEGAVMFYEAIEKLKKYLDYNF